MAKEINCNITREIAVLSSNHNGWQLELNEVAWNDGAPKLELRRWAPNHEKSNRGVTLTSEEAKGFPTIKIGKRMTVPKDKLIEWIDKQMTAL